MKLTTKNYLTALAPVLTFILIGCTTTKPSAYSYMPDPASGAIVSFGTGSENPGVKFVALDGVPPEAPGKGTYWEPIVLPAGRELRITVHAEYTQSDTVIYTGLGAAGEIANKVQEINAAIRNVSTYVIFNCPPLQAGKTYRLAFLKESGIPGKNILILSDVGTREVVYQQEFETDLLGRQK